MRKARDQQGKGEEGVSLGGRVTILKAGRTSRIAAWFIFLVALVFFMIFILDTWGSIEGASWISVIAVAAVLVGVTWLPWTLILIVYAKAYAVSDYGITRYSVWSPPLTLRWEEISKIGFIPLYDMFVVNSGRGKIRISPLLEGVQVFAEGVIDRVPRDKWRNVDKLIRKASKGPFIPDW